MPRKFNFESYYIRCARYRHEPWSKREPKWKEEEKEIEEGESGDLRRYKRDGNSRIEQQKGRGARILRRRGRNGEARGFAVGQAVRRTAS